MNRIERTSYGVLLSICVCHGINDMIQSLLAAVYPTLKEHFALSFGQIGVVTLAYQLTASLLQPLIGLSSDRTPRPFSLPAGTIFTFAGLVTLSTAETYPGLVAGACVLGIGSSVFHPESSRVATMASGGRPGLAQSLFQVGGNVGSTLGPLAAAVVVLRWGRASLSAFGGLALVSTAILTSVGLWYRRRLDAGGGHPKKRNLSGAAPTLSRARIVGTLAVLLVLIFSRFAYSAGFASYYTFYLMDHFGVSLGSAQVHLFEFLAAGSAGTLAGGPLADRFGRKGVIWFSILGVLPLAVFLPYAGLDGTRWLSAVIAFVLATAFPAIVTYGQELLPDRIGMVSGLFFGLAFGAAGCGAALLGLLADRYGIGAVFKACALLPSLGILAALLPDLGALRQGSAARTSPHVAPEARRTD
jgi:FSR family fosmidomycin resistance protein-like MFS transporter